jgi:hypothetical protein
MYINKYHSHNLPAQAGGSRVPVYFTVHDTGAVTFC